jgi:hypothetical protein
MMTKREAHNHQGTEVPIAQILRHDGVNRPRVLRVYPQGPKPAPKGTKLPRGAPTHKFKMAMLSLPPDFICWREAK